MSHHNQQGLDWRFPEHLRVSATITGVAIHRYWYTPTYGGLPRTRVGPKPSVQRKRQWKRERRPGESYKTWQRRAGLREAA